MLEHKVTKIITILSPFFFGRITVVNCTEEAGFCRAKLGILDTHTLRSETWLERYLCQAQYHKEVYKVTIKRNFKAALVLSAALAASAITPAMAAEYNFSGLQPGGAFYQPTVVGTEPAAGSVDSSTIVVGADGTIGIDASAKPNSSPLNGLTLPVGEYPDSWGMATDINIAQTSVFPNFFAPPSQWINIDGFIALDPYTVSSGALPTGYQVTQNSVYYGVPYYSY